MGRMTRAKAAAVAEQLHMDQDALLEMNAPDSAAVLSSVSQTAEDREPLCEMSPNSATSSIEPHDDQTKVESKKTTDLSQRSNKKGARNEKSYDTLDASTASAQDGQTPEDKPDGLEAAQSPARRAASDDLMKDVAELQVSHLPVHDNMPTTPSSTAAAGLNRSQLRELPNGLQAAEQDPVLDVGPSHIVDQETSQDGKLQEPGQTSTEPVNSQVSCERPVLATMPNVLQLNSQTPPRSSNSSGPHCEAVPIMGTTNIENVDPKEEYDQLEKAVVEASTPPKSNPKPPRIPATKSTYDQLETAVLSAPSSPSNATSMMMTSQDPFEALDAQDDAVEKVAAEVPDVQDSPQKPRSKKVAPTVRTTKASQARISLAHGLPNAPPKAPAMGRPRQSMSDSTSKRITSTSSMRSADGPEDEVVVEKKEVVIPHSKPRPMSMQFKAPPPPAKSTKAPTQSNFQLPGEAVAAKLKAAREARLQKEAESRQKKVFKARPAPSMSKAPEVRQTSTSKARESIINGRPLAASVGAARPKSVVATSRPGSSFRSAMSTAKPRAAAVRPSTTPKPAVSRLSAAPAKTKDIAVTKRPSTVLGTSSTTSRPRPSTVMGTASSRPRTSLASKPNPSAAPAPARPMFQAGNGKAVFNRAAEAKSAAAQQKRDKEEAAKQARAAASERSRQLSREWAEKQKAKKAGGKSSEVKSALAEMKQSAKVDVVEIAGAGAVSPAGILE